MSKVAAYLQEHILGEVIIQPSVLDTYSTDASILTVRPEMVVYPRVTNDIRKVARFAWQLAEKGHILPITARGSGTDQTGAAIGRGIIVAMPAHMNQLLEFDARQKLVRVQPGLNAKALADALFLQGMGVPALPRSRAYSTVGGAVANNATSPRSARSGSMRHWVHQLEVILANGDVLQTERISKRDLNKKKGLQTLEGEIYRAIDNLLDDYAETIETKIGQDEVRNNAGYAAIREVRQRDGSIDLTPLFVGSQGTLGIISEMILKADYLPSKRGVVVASFATAESARDALDALTGFDPAMLEYYDGELFAEADKQGARYSVYSNTDHRAVIVMVFEDFNDHAVARRLKKVTKYLAQTDADVTTSETVSEDELLVIRDVMNYVLVPATKGISAPPILDGVYIPSNRREEFIDKIDELARKHHVVLSPYGDMLDHVWYVRPHFQLAKVSDKQKILKLLEEYMDVVDSLGGYGVAEAGEGRLKVRAAQKNVDDDVLEMYDVIKAIFDPNGILNPDVKQPVELRQLVSQLRNDYDMSEIARHGLWN